MPEKSAEKDNYGRNLIDLIMNVIQKVFSSEKWSSRSDQGFGVVIPALLIVTILVFFVTIFIAIRTAV